MRASALFKRWRAVVVCCGLLLTSAAMALPAPPDNTVYANVGTSMYSVNPVTGAAVVVGNLSFSTSGFGRDPITGRVYYAEAALPGRVAYWDPTTGLNTVLPTALGFATNRMGFRADGVMFSMNPATNNIYVIDKVTGNPSIVATVVGPPLNGGGDMAFTPAGDLYIVTNSTIYRVFGNPIAVPAAGAIPALASVGYATGTTGSPTGMAFIDNGTALGTPTTGIVDLNVTGGFTNARGANSYSDIGVMPKFADLGISVTPSTPNFPRTGSASYSVNINNSGPQSGSGPFTVSFTLPAGETLVGAGPFGSGWSCVAGAPVVCTNSTASLVAGAGLPTLGVPVSTAVAVGTNSLSTTFAVAGTTFDPATANNSGTVVVGVGAAAISKVFSPATVAPGGTSTLVFTLSNPTATAFTGLSFSDTLPTAPGAMKVAAVPNAITSNCGTPTFAPVAAAASVSFSGGSLAAGGVCTVRVDVTASTPGSYSNTSSGVVSTQTGAAAGAPSNTANLLVMSPATISKAFATSPVIPGGPSALTITLSNPLANGSNDIIGATFTDVLPTTPGAMTLADAVVSSTCGGTLSDAGGAALAAGSTAVKLVGGTVPANASCVVKLNVKGGVAGTYNNTAGAVSSANAGSGAVSNTAPLVVQNIVAPSIAKNFAPAQIAVGATSVLSFTVTNPNPTTALTGVAFSDIFPVTPGNMTVAATPGASTSGCGTPTFAPAANAASVTFSAGTIAAGGTCTVNVNVTVNAVGAYTNVSNAVTATGPIALTGNTATAVVATLAPPVVAKAFSPATIGTNGVSTVTISISNPNGSQTLTGVAMTDAFPANLKVAAVPNASVSGCGAPAYAPVAAATSVAFGNGSIVGGGVCVMKFDVTSAVNGSYTNNTGAVTTANGGSGLSDSDTLTVQAAAPPSIGKAFLTSPMAMGVPAVLRFTLSNPNPLTALTGVAFSDSLPTAPGAMVVAATPGISSSGCGAPTFAPPAGAATLSFSGGSIAAGAICTVNVNVVAAVAGSYANTTSTVTSTTPATTGLTASANVDVLAPPALSKSFVTNPVAVGVPTTLRFDVSNPNGLVLNSLAFSDSLPTTPGAMVVAAVPNISIGAGCGSTSFAPAAGASSIGFSTSSIAAGATCRVTVDVVAPVVGSYANTTSAITSANGGNGPAANATLTVVSLNLPTLNKSFASAGPIAPGVANVLTISIGNSNASAITLSSALVDNLPSGVTVASPAGSVGTCAGVTATPGDSKITLANGSSIPAGGCTIVANVVASAGGIFTNTLAAGALTTSAGSNAVATSASFSVPFAPVATKSFTPASVAVGVTSQLKITLANPNAGTAITGAAFTDTYPAGLVNTAAANGTLSGVGCLGTVTAANGGTSLVFGGGTIPAGGSCDITVNVSSASAASYLNSTGAISTGNVGSGNASSATLTVAVGVPLTVLKSFSAASIAPNATAVLKIRLTNPNAVAITGAAFTDNYPGGLVNTAAPAGSISGAGCTGSLTAAVNGTSLALAAGNIPASSFCDFTANVSSATPGSYVNNSGAVATTNGGTASGSSASLVVLSPPNVLKSFSPASVSVGSSSQLKITINNPNAGTALTGVSFTDTYPAGLLNTASAAGTLSGAGCVGTVAAANGGNTLSLSAGTVPAGGSCDITVNVSSATAAAYNNSSGVVTTTNAGNGSASIGTLNVVSGLAPLTVSKSFAPATVGTNDSTVMSITLLNPNAVAVTGAAFSDGYPFSLFNTATPAAAVSGTAGCAGTLSAAANGSLMVLSGGNVPAGGSCTFSANVSSNAAGTVLNSSGVVSTSNAGSTASAIGTLTVLSHITVGKTFTPNTITVGGVSVLKITLNNPNAVAVTGVSFNDAYPGGLVNTATPAGAINGAGCTGTVVAAAGGSSVSISGGVIPPNSSCALVVSVSSSLVGSYLNSIAAGALSSSSGSNVLGDSATLNVTAAAGVQVGGFVYADANHNTQRDSGEAGTGLVWFAKLVPTVSASGPAIQAVVVDPATGAYAFSNVAAGNYVVLIDDNNTLSDITPSITSSWTGTENADGTRRNLAVAAVDIANLNFGLFNGNLVTGRVFRDNGSGAGVAHNGIQDGGEAGLANAVLRLTNGGSTTYDTTTSAADGSWRLWLASTLAGTPLRVVQDPLIGYRAVAGAPAPSYDRASNSITLNYTLGTALSGLNFGDVATESLSAPQQGAAAAGSSVIYAHRYTPGTVGSLTFNMSGSAVWPTTLYLDSNCNGALDAAEPVLSAALSTTAGTPVCVIVKVNVPPGTAVGAQQVLSLQANLAYSNATPALNSSLVNEDLTTVGGAAPAASALLLVKSQDNAAPVPGARITYTLSFTNQGSTALSAVRISDFTPAYTRFVNAACVSPLAAGLSACTVSLSPAAGATGGIEWLLSGNLLPSASGQVSFAVDLVSTP